MGTIVWWRKVGVKAMGLTLLAACNSRPQFPAVDLAQRVAVLEAAGKLRDAFNGNAGCEAIYSGVPPSVQSYPKERWLADCAQLQSDMGSWQTFRPQVIERCAMPETVICLLGEAAFTKGSRILELRWLLDGGRAQFLAISWQGGIQWISIPPLDLHHNLRDTPPVPGKSPSGKRG